MKSRLPAPLLRVVRSAREALGGILLRLFYRGRAYYCPVCLSRLRTLLPYGDPPRPNERCPICLAMARHRLDWLFMEQKTDLLDGAPKRMLHVAPEPCLMKRFRQVPRLEYVSGDLASPLADVKLDLTDLEFADETFDAIYCSHVLEHIEDDLSAIREIHRVCRKTGWAILQVPITAEKTFEDPSVTDPEQRRQLFGQHDHVRRYGPDYTDRLDAGGFTTEIVYARDLLTPHECELQGIKEDHLVFFCRPR